MGLKPALWGAEYWGIIHINAKRLDAFREEGQTKKFLKDLGDRLAQWFDYIPESLPCEGCGMHARAYLQAHPVPSERVFEWSVEFHNYVNRKLGAREWSVREAEITLTNKYGNTVVTEISRAEEMRKEDGKKIQRLIAELERMGHRDPDADEQQEKRWGYKATWLVLGMLTSAVFLITLWLLSRYVF